jgi:hypothetical protein
VCGRGVSGTGGNARVEFAGHLVDAPQAAGEPGLVSVGTESFLVGGAVAQQPRGPQEIAGGEVGSVFLGPLASFPVQLDALHVASPLAVIAASKRVGSRVCIPVADPLPLVRQDDEPAVCSSFSEPCDLVAASSRFPEGATRVRPGQSPGAAGRLGAAGQEVLGQPLTVVGQLSCPRSRAAA